MADSETPRMADSEAQTPEPQQQTFLQKLKDGEQYWPWKCSLRVVMCVLDVIGIGCAAWLIARRSTLDVNPYIGYFEEREVTPGTLIMLSISFVWCLLTILVLVLRKPPRPIHPGAIVGIDLIIWLALIVTGLFSVVALISVIDFGKSGELYDPSYSSDYNGNYYLNTSNNTWIYNVTSVYDRSNSYYSDYYYNSTLGTWIYNETTPDVSSVTRDCTPYFTNCEQQDKYINNLWHTKSTRVGCAGVSTAIQWIGVLIHFILFVWACVDTNRRNRSRKDRKAQAVAVKMVQEMEAKGLISTQVHAMGGAQQRGGPFPPQMQQQAPQGAAPQHPEQAHVAPHGTANAPHMGANENEIQPAATSARYA